MIVEENSSTIRLVLVWERDWKQHKPEKAQQML